MKMQNFRQYLQKNIVLADGAMGTYLASLNGRNSAACERLNLDRPELIEKVHREYARAGAKLLLTNTFAANRFSLGSDGREVEKIIRAGVSIARGAAGNVAFAAADIGPVPAQTESSEARAEYRRIADVFLQEGMEVFQFETFGESEFPIETAKYIRSRRPDAFISVSFAVQPDGCSHLGRSAASLLKDVVKSGAADAVGFNCCSGPAHLIEVAKGLDYGGLFPSIMPNAGYPDRENVDDAPVYTSSPEYFARTVSGAAQSGFRIIGGCCGTTPEHIRLLGQLLHEPHRREQVEKRVETVVTNLKPESQGGHSAEKLKPFIIELDPPFNADSSKVEKAAIAAKECGASAVTIADSPMARPRADSMMMAARLKRIARIDVIPHLCCRDRNINAIKSALIAAHIEGIRRILAVTGDPVPDTDRGIVKSVYNFNSAGLCAFVRDLDADIFSQEPVSCGCALNVNAANPANELEKLRKKIASGASFALTQPVFSDKAREMLEKAKTLGIRIFAGILPPVGYRNAMFLANEIPGLCFPKEFVARFSPEMSREEGEQTGIAIAAEAARIAAPLCDGFYFMTPFNRVHVVAQIVNRLGKEK